MYGRENIRRIIILGAGAIGCALGGHLALSGSEVILIGRPRHIGLISRNGLKFITPSGTHILKLKAVASVEQIDFKPEDVVFLCAKGQNTEGAIQDLRKAVKDVPVFCFQNGVRNEENVATYFSRVYGAMIRIGGEYITDGEVTVRRDPPGWVVMGCYPRGKDALAESVAETLRVAGFYVLVSPDVMPYKWGKLMLNLNNAVGAITDAKWGEVRLIGQAVTEEARKVLAEAGVSWKSQEELAREWPDFNSKPRRVLQTTEQSSTWQSLARKQGTVETDFLNGEIVRVAERIGKKAPLNESLVRITKEMAVSRDLPGKYSPIELQKILGLV